MKRAAVAAAAMLCITAWTATCQADTIDALGNPFEYFNVYSLGGIGTAGSAYGSDIQGRTGAAGDAYFSSFSLLNMPNQSGWALHAGGNVSLSGTYLGDIDAGGNVAIGNVGISGSIHAGGNVTQFAGGGIGGNVIAGGSAQLDQTMTVNGQTLSGQAYAPAVNHNAVSQYFLNEADRIAEMTPTGEFSDEWGHLTFAGSEGVNVVNINSAELRDAWQVTIDAPEGSVVYINVPDDAVSLDWTGWEYAGGVGPKDVVVNMAHALSLKLSSTNAVNILAPRADTNFESGLVAGSLIVGYLKGSGQVNMGSFGHGAPVPEPASTLLLACGAAAMLRKRRQHRLA